jgi:hypothetical protein
MMDKNRDKDSQAKDDFSLYMINTKAVSSVLFIRKLNPSDFVLSIYQKALETKDGVERFKICFLKQTDIEQMLKQKGVFSSQFDEENQVVSQLGKSIINNSKCICESYM